MSTYRSRADQRVVDEETVDRRLMCSAHGCPNRWTTTHPSNLCRWHAAADPHYWPRITQEQVDAETDRALAAGMDRPEPVDSPMSLAEKRAVTQRFQRALEAARQNPRAWIERLEKRQRDGYTLSAGQKHALEQVRKPLDFGDIA